MRKPLLLFFLGVPFAAGAQKLAATAPATTYHVGQEKLLLYQHSADTAAGKSGTYLYPGAEAIVVGELSPRWVVVKRDGFLYLASTQKLTDYSPGVVKALAQQSAQTRAVLKLSNGTVLPYDADTRLITYQGVIEVPGATKEQLATRAQRWLSATASPDKPNQLTSKGSWPVTFHVMMAGTMPAGFVQYTLTLYFKDGRYKYVLTNLTHVSDGGDRSVPTAGPLEQNDVQLVMMGGKRPWEGVRVQANDKAQKLVADLQAAMKDTKVKDPSDF